MSATLLTGPINSGKTERALKLLSRCDPGRTGTMIVPDRGTAAEVRRRFSASAAGAVRATRTDSIRDWGAFVRTLASPSLPVATRRQSALIVLGLMPKLKLSCFGPPTRSFSLARAFARTILSLKENLVKPADLDEILGALGEVRPRERDLIKAYEAYEKELSRLGILDEADLPVLAIKGALDGAPILAETKVVIFDEFAMPAPAHIAMVRALSTGLPGADILVTCPSARGEEERPFAEWLDRARDCWLAACDAHEELAAPEPKASEAEVLCAPSPAQEARHVSLMIAASELPAQDVVVAARRDDSFLEWFLSEAHSLELLHEHPTLDGAAGSTLAHEILSPETLERLPPKAGMRPFVERTLALADLKGRAKRWVGALRERRGHGRVAARSLTAAAAVEETLRALLAFAPLLGRAEISRDQFSQLLSHELGQRAASSTMVESVLPFRRIDQGVPLASETRRLIVPRMIEGGFPSRGGETVFFGDWKEESIRRIFPDAEDAHARESYAFETMIKKCAGRITLLLPAVDDSGGETFPSPFAERFLGGERPGALGPCVLNRTSAGRKGEELKFIHRVECARARGEVPPGSGLASYMGELESEDARSMVRARFTAAELAPTALERYANCPFSFFAQDVLRVREAPEETPQVRGFDRGSLVHEILARYYRDSGTGDRGPGFRTNKGLDGIVGRIAQKVWDERAEDLGYVSPGLRGREQDETAGMALAVIRAEADEAAQISSPLLPREFEWEFANSRGNALEIDMGRDEPLRIRGRVDRIDADDDASRFLVIDYKSGGADQVANRIESGRHLQLPLYIDAVKRSLMRKALPLGGLLVAIKEIERAGDEKKTPGKTKGLVLKEFDGACYRIGRSHAAVSGDRMDELIRSARERAAGFASLIRKGLFPASDEADCRKCEYGDICRHKRLSAD